MTGKNRQTLHDALEAELAPVRLRASRKAAILAAAGEARSARRGGRPWRVGLTAAALCAALVMTAVAASPSLREALAHMLGGFEPYAQEVEGVSVTDQGIQMTVLSAVADSEDGRVYLELRDLEGDRLTEFTLLDERATTGYYDPEERTLLVELRLQEKMRNGDGTATVSFSSVWGGAELDIPLPAELMEPENVLDSFEWTEEDMQEIPEPDGSVSSRYPLVLAPDQTPMALEGADLVSLSSMGFDEKGHLHVQLALADGVEEGWLYVNYQRQGEWVPGPGAQRSITLSDGEYVDLRQEPYWESVFLPEDYQGMEARVRGYVMTRPEVRGTWTLTFPLEILPDRTVDIGQVVNGLNVDTIRLTAMNLYLDGTWNTTAGSLFCPVTLYLKDGTIRQVERIGINHIGTRGPDHSFSNQWRYDDPVEPDQVTAIALGYWYIPLEGDTAGPGHWLEELPAQEPPSD